MNQLLRSAFRWASYSEIERKERNSISYNCRVSIPSYAGPFVRLLGHGSNCLNPCRYPRLFLINQDKYIQKNEPVSPSTYTRAPLENKNCNSPNWPRMHPQTPSTQHTSSRSKYNPLNSPTSVPDQC